MDGAVELEIPASAEFLSLARLVVSAASTFAPRFNPDRLDDLRLAVSEAATNAIEEQQRVNAESGGTGGITLRCRVDDRGDLEVEVGDHGNGFDPADLAAHPPVTDPARLDYERGLGIPLIRLLTDRAEWRPSPTGTTVRMVISSARRA